MFVRGCGCLHCPVVVAIAGGGPAGLAVKFRVGDGDRTAWVLVSIDLWRDDEGILTSLITRDEHLTTNEVDLDVINPDVVGTIESNGITTPDELRVQLSDVNVLNDNIANTGQTETLTTNNTLTANTDNRLVRPNINTLNASLVVRTSGSRVAATPVGVIDGILASAAAGVGLGDTALAVGALALCAEVVELLVDEDGTRSAVGQPLGQFGGIARCSGDCTATASGA